MTSRQRCDATVDCRDLRVPTQSQAKAVLYLALSTTAAVRLQVNQLFEQFGGKAKLDELKDKAGKVRSPDVQPLESNLLSIRAALHWFLADGTHRRLVTSWRLLSPDLSQRPAKSWPLTVSSLPSDNGFERFGLRPGK